MKGVWKCSLGLSLGLLAGGALGQEPQWRPANPTPIAQAGRPQEPPDVRPAATLARPVPQPGPAEAPAAPAATLARPMPLAVVDTQVQPASFLGSGSGPLAAIVRGLSPDTPKPMPVGPAPADGSTLKMPTKILDSHAPTPETIIPPPDPVPDGGLPVVEGDGYLSGDEPGMVEADAVDGPVEGFGGSGHRFYARAEYLMWWIKNSPAPPLVSASNVSTGTPGAITDPNTHVIFGGDGIFLQTRSGGRFTAGYWFGDDEAFGVEGSFFFLGQGGAHFAAGSMGVPGLFRPFFSSEQNGRPVAEEIAGVVPRRLSGVVGIDLPSRVWGYELNLQGALCGDPCSSFRLVALGGFRFFGLDESLRISENLTILPDPADPLAPQRGGFLISDRFGVKNRFYAPQAGLKAEFQRGPWSLDVTGKLAMGVTHEVVDITGVTFINLPTGASVERTGGLLAQPTNIGRFERNRFAVMPEVGANIGYQVTDNFRIFVGYSFLYVSSVVRPGDQIDPNINRSQIPRSRAPAELVGHPRPLFEFRGSDFWAHGANIGLEFRY
jgi:hypothetical protein